MVSDSEREQEEKNDEKEQEKRKKAWEYQQRTRGGFYQRDSSLIGDIKGERDEQTSQRGQYYGKMDNSKRGDMVNLALKTKDELIEKELTKISGSQLKNMILDVADEEMTDNEASYVIRIMMNKNMIRNNEELNIPLSASEQTYEIVPQETNQVPSGNSKYPYPLFNNYGDIDEERMRILNILISRAENELKSNTFPNGKMNGDEMKRFVLDLTNDNILMKRMEACFVIKKLAEKKIITHTENKAEEPLCSVGQIFEINRHT